MTENEQKRKETEFFFSMYEAGHSKLVPWVFKENIFKDIVTISKGPASK